MQNRNFIRIFTILFAIVCLYQLSFTWMAGQVEDDALSYAASYPENEQEERERLYLDSIRSEKVYDVFFTEYSYADCNQEN